MAKTAEQTLKSLQKCFGEVLGTEGISSGGCTEISTTSEKVSKDDPEETHVLFFAPLEMGGVWDSSCAGCFYLAKELQDYNGIERKSSCTLTEWPCGCHQDPAVELQVGLRGPEVREWQHTP